MPVTKISENEEFGPFINSAAGKLIVIDFYADWCGPCKAIAPYVEELSNTYAAKAVFAKVDIQACDQIASAYNVSGIPYFVFIREGRMVDSLTGAKKDVLKQKIEENINAMNSAGTGEGGSSTLYGIQKAMDLSSEVDKNASECLNEDDEHPWTNAVLDANNAGTCLKSDCDEQLLGLRKIFE